MQHKTMWMWACDEAAPKKHSPRLKSKVVRSARGSVFGGGAGVGACLIKGVFAGTEGTVVLGVGAETGLVCEAGVSQSTKFVFAKTARSSSRLPVVSSGEASCRISLRVCRYCDMLTLWPRRLVVKLLIVAFCRWVGPPVVRVVRGCLSTLYDIGWRCSVLYFNDSEVSWIANLCAWQQVVYSCGGSDGGVVLCCVVWCWD